MGHARAVKLVTLDGKLASVPVRERGWPLAGLEPFDQQTTLGNRTIRLLDTADGAVRAQTFQAVYRSNPWVWAAVNAVARGLARFPIKVGSINDQGHLTELEVPADPGPGAPSGAERLVALFRRPAPRTSRYQLVYGIAVDLMVYGNALIFADGEPGQPISALWHVPWERVTVRFGSELPIISYDLRSKFGDLNVRSLDPDRCVHIGVGSDPRSSGQLGASPLESLRYTLALFEALQRHLTSFFSNAARPSGVLKVANEHSIDKVRRQIQSMYGSPENAGRVLVTNGEWQEMGSDPTQAAVVELIKLSREEILAAFGVPPPLAGVLDRAIFSNVKELRTHYVRDTIGPWADRIESDLNAQLLTMSRSWEGLVAFYDLDEQLQPDLEARAGALAKLRSTYSLNERRKRENLPPIDDPMADAVFLPLAERPVGEGIDQDEFDQPTTETPPGSPDPDGGEPFPEEEDEDVPSA